jgi:hypothetical protein
MRCHICGGKAFTSSEYCTNGVRAPAKECASCLALVLDERAATSDEERDSVRWAVAARAAYCAGEPFRRRRPGDEPETRPGGSAVCRGRG